MPDMPADPDRSRGRYLHLDAGRPAGVEERYVAGQVGDGVRIRSIRVAASPASRLETDLRLSAAGASAVVRWTGSGDGVVRDASLECTWLDGAVELRRTVEGTTSGPILVQGRLLLPGLVLAGTADPGPAHGVQVEPRDAEALLAPRPCVVEVEDLGEDAVELGGRPVVGRRQRRTFVGLDLPVVEDVVDAGGLLLRRTVGAFEARLAEATGPWPAPATWPRLARTPAQTDHLCVYAPHNEKLISLSEGRGATRGRRRGRGARARSAPRAGG
jgi:hypothetical protein